MTDPTYETESHHTTESRDRDARLVGHEVKVDTSKETVMQLADELAMGCLNHQPRWSGDTHFDLGGSVREDETDQMMEQGAKCLRALLAERDALEAAEKRGYARGGEAAPVVPKVKPLVFEWAHQPTENPSEHITIGNGYSARVYIPYEDGNDPASGVGTWCGVAQQRGQSGFSSKEAAVAYCEETIRDYARAAVNGASNFIDMAPVTLQEAARVLRDAPELMEGWSEDGWADICALAEQEGPSTPPRDGVE